MKRILAMILLLLILIPCTYVSAEPLPHVSIHSLESFEKIVINREDSASVMDKLELERMLKFFDTYGYPMVTDTSLVDDFFMYFSTYEGHRSLRYTINGVEYRFYCEKNTEPPEYRDSGCVISRTIFDSEIPLYQRQKASDVEYLSGTVYSENLSVAVQVYDYETYEDIDFQAFGWSKEMVPLEIEVDSVRSFWRQTWQFVHQYAGIILICGTLLGLILVPLVAVLVAFLAELVRKVRRSKVERSE